MDDPTKQKRTYRILGALFLVAGVVWIVYGFFSPRYLFYPAIGLANLGVAYVCKKFGE